MTGRDDQQAAELVTLLQSGVPLEENPFERLGRRVGMSGDEVLRCAQALLAEGAARRFGGVFDSRSLGYRSTLCAVDVPGPEIDRAAARLTPDPGVTHCYLREGRPNLWFTLTARADLFDAALARMGAMLAPWPLLDLPALRRFKIMAVFDPRGKDQPAGEDRLRPPAPVAPAAPVAPLCEEERRAVRELQGHVPLSADPFRDLAARLGLRHERLLDMMQAWQRNGVLRRVGLIMRHTRLGFAANGMCVWRVDADRIAQAGRIMAAHPEVSHCYERPFSAAFPFNLYAMVHAATPEELARCAARLSAEAGLEAGQIMMSVREFKKSSPVYFCEGDRVGALKETGHAG